MTGDTEGGREAGKEMETGGDRREWMMLLTRLSAAYCNKLTSQMSAARHLLQVNIKGDAFARLSMLIKYYIFKCKYSLGATVGYCD